MQRPHPFDREAATPWAPASFAFCALWTTGPDPDQDRVLRVLALRRAGDTWETLDRCCAQPAGTSDRTRREFGLTAADLADAPPADEVWAELAAFLEGHAPVAPDGDDFERWYAAGTGRDAPPTTGLAEVAALLSPGRWATGGRTLVQALGPTNPEAPSAACYPTDLVLALGELVRRFQDLGPSVARLAAEGYGRAWHTLRVADPGGARRLGLALALVEHPSRWCGGSGELFSGGAVPVEGCLSGALAGVTYGSSEPEELLLDLDPRWTRDWEDWKGFEPLPPAVATPAPLSDEDRRWLDDVFEVHLPEVLADEHGGAPANYLRPSQHAVAREVGATLGQDELLLVHAPTGTGKTLAYLVPAILWARRHGARAGVATYTRALQEQAMEREVPRALAVLARAGHPPGTRVSVLKGRENYLCWRALRQVAPTVDDDPEQWLAWTGLALFAATDPWGDLDRLPRRPPVRLDAPQHLRAVLRGLLRQVRAQTACCTGRGDRSTCGAEIARRRAERSHVVVTNHSFALARPEFLRNTVFDECEHLHDGALSAWSHRLTFRHARDVLGRLHRPGRSGRGGRAVLDRLGERLLPGTIAGEVLDLARKHWETVRRELEGVEREARRFLDWRRARQPERSEDQEHALLRLYVEEHGAALVIARRRLELGLHELDAHTALLVEHLDRLPVRNVARLRRSLELARTDLAELTEAVVAWLPLQDDCVLFRGDTFHDVEQDEAGELAIVAQVLLPHEALGRRFHPLLQSAAFLSATTRLGGGFDAARRYLGLERAEHPADSEPREGRRVRTFAAPEAFDYSRVLIGVPRDAPSVHDKAAFLDHTSRFLEHLARRTRGRVLALFTSLADVRVVGEALAPRFREQHLPLLYQGMRDADKEELAALFRDRTDSVLLGVDTFWYGADFPGETLEYLVIVRLPYGVPDRYHHAQQAAMGRGRQREAIYLPRALAKFRQGFGRLMRRASDRGCVFVLDQRLLDPRHRHYLKELPLGVERAFGRGDAAPGARLVRGETDRVLHEAFAHMGLLAELERRGLPVGMGGRPVPGAPVAAGRDEPLPARAAAADAGPPPADAGADPAPAPEDEPPPSGPMFVDPGDVPF